MSNVEKDYEVDISDLEFEKIIGSGANAEVWEGTFKPKGQKVAIKKLYPNQFTEKTMNLFIREIKCLSAFKHQFLLPFIGYTASNPLCIVTKLITNDSLYSALRSDPKNLQLSPTDLSIIAYGISIGMKFLHQKHIIHRDLKPQNVLIDENRLPVICDFGSSRFLEGSQNNTNTHFGTVQYMAPEFLKGVTYDERIDVYSFGICLWEMLTKQTPFDGFEPGQIICKVVIDSDRPELEGKIDPLSRLIKKCWDTDPQNRPTFSEITSLFETYSVYFPGSDMAIFKEIVRKEFRTNKAFVGISPKIVSSPSQSRRNSSSSINYVHNRFDTLPSSLLNPSVLNHNVSSLQDSFEVIIGGTDHEIEVALQHIESNIDSPGLSKCIIWPRVLVLLTRCSGSLLVMAQNVSHLLAKNFDILVTIQKVHDLHSYVKVSTLEIFLYVVNFIPSLINSSIVSSLISISKNEESNERAEILLCKIFIQTTEKELKSLIHSYFSENLSFYCNRIGGSSILDTLSSIQSIPNENILLFLHSIHSSNCISAYRAIMYLKDPLLVPLDDITYHLKSENNTLRECSLDYLLCHHQIIDYQTNRCIIRTLIDIASMFQGQKPFLLLCRYAQSSQYFCYFLEPRLLSIWMKSATSVAADFFRLFFVIFMNHPERTSFFLNQTSIEYISSSLLSDRIEVFAYASILFQMVSDCSIESDLMTKYINRLVVIQSYNGLIQSGIKTLIMCFKSIPKGCYQPLLSFLFGIIMIGHPLAYASIELIHTFSLHRDTHMELVDANIFAVFSRYNADESKPLIRSILDNIKTGGVLEMLL